MEKTLKFKPKLCAECGKEFAPQSSQAKYCPSCTITVRRQKTAERTRRWRARMKEPVAG